MQPRYDLNWVQQQYTDNGQLDARYFWGHQPRKNGQIGESCFSQWWHEGFRLDGKTFATAEHWMMYEKARLFDDTASMSAILAAASPQEVKELGRQVVGFEDETWRAERYAIVYQGNYHKFSQDDPMREFLLSTGEAVLVEASPYDRIWGIGLKKGDAGFDNPFQWRGENLLGFALMEVRDRLRAEANA